MQPGATRFGAISVVLASLAGFAWIALEFVQPSLGFDDTDNPAVTLQFLADHRDVWANAGFVLLAMAVALVAATFSVADVLAPRSNSLTVRFISVFGLLAAASFFMFGVLRSASGPVLYIDGLRHEWGQSAFLVIQMVGVHGFAQAAVLAFCLWAVSISVVGLRSRALPRAVCLLGLLPAIRVVLLMHGAAGRLDTLPDALWVVAMIAIPGTFLWSLILGLVLLRRSLRPSAVQQAGAGA